MKQMQNFEASYQKAANLRASMSMIRMCVSFTPTICYFTMARATQIGEITKFPNHCFRSQCYLQQ